MERKRLLVVDDEELLLELFKSLFEAEGFDVETALDGVQAVTKLKEKRFDLVLTGIRMPRISGLELLEYLKENIPGQKVIVVSGYASARLPALQLGILEFIQKPPDTVHLLASVRRALNV